MLLLRVLLKRISLRALFRRPRFVRLWMLISRATRKVRIRLRSSILCRLIVRRLSSRRLLISRYRLSKFSWVSDTA